MDGSFDGVILLRNKS